MRMLRSLLILSTILSNTANAWAPLSVDNLAFEYLSLRPENRDPYAPESTGWWKEQVALRWDLRAFQHVYWNNRVHTETTNPSGTVHGVGWQWELGVSLGKSVDLFHSHHSRHVMEREAERRFEGHNQFPVEDGYGIRINLIKGGK